MLKNGTLLKVSPELIQALKNALDLRYLPLIQQARRQRRSLITDDVEASAEYNGYFKLVNLSYTDDEGAFIYRIGVVDGATFRYKEDTVSSGNSLLYVNNVKHELPLKMFTIPQTQGVTYYIEVQYVWKTNTSHIRCTTGDFLPSDDSVKSVQIGTVKVDADNNELILDQWFTEDGAAHLSIDYTGEFKLYRKVDEYGRTESFGMAGGRCDACADVTETAIESSAETGTNVYVNFTVEGEGENAKIVAEASTERLGWGTDGVSIPIGYIGNYLDRTVHHQHTTGMIQLAGDYVV